MAWSVDASRQLYRVPTWSNGYFDINNKGHVIVAPDSKHPQHNLDIHNLAQHLQQKGLRLPILIRFTDILKDRITNLIEAFQAAMQGHDYPKDYKAVYPIKVNQQRRVIEDIVRFGKDHVGLEAGSKPELLINIALASPGSTIICNGYKDREYIRLALVARELGFRVYIVVEKLSELALITECAQELSIEPLLGLRIRLDSIAKGNWQNTGGEKSKFGLHANQILEAIEILRDHGLVNALELLHFRIGSQVSSLDYFRKGLQEGARYYAELRQLSVPIACLDIGGGLGVDYEGNHSNNLCSMNYTVQEYADTVIGALKDICDAEDLPYPDIITESGRAMTAHHAMLITNIIDIERPVGSKPHPLNDHDTIETVGRMKSLLENCNPGNAVETYRESAACIETARLQFTRGELNLKQKARIEELYYAICYKAMDMLTEDEPDLAAELREKLADKYFCNFSLFQTIPDTWAIDQIFPIMPIQYLEEEPVQRATLQDLTCDSDGRIDFYVDVEGTNTSLPVHALETHNDYLIGIFLLGAYQEILGDMHNLFGDTASVNVELTDDGHYSLSEFDFGETVSDLFGYIHIDPERLRTIYQDRINNCSVPVDKKTAFLELLTSGLDGYTYLEND